MDSPPPPPIAPLEHARGRNWSHYFDCWGVVKVRKGCFPEESRGNPEVVPVCPVCIYTNTHVRVHALFVCEQPGVADRNTRRAEPLKLYEGLLRAQPPPPPCGLGQLYVFQGGNGWRTLGFLSAVCST